MSTSDDMLGLWYTSYNRSLKGSSSVKKEKKRKEKKKEKKRKEKKRKEKKRKEKKRKEKKRKEKKSKVKRKEKKRKEKKRKEKKKIVLYQQNKIKANTVNTCFLYEILKILIRNLLTGGTPNMEVTWI